MLIQNFAENIYEKDGLWFSKKQREISYPKEGNEHCFQIEQDSFWFNHRNNCIISAVKKYSPNDVFFDIGGGNGFVAKGLEAENIQTVLVEPGLEGALNAKRRGLSNVVCSTLEDAAFKANAIKSVGLFDVVEHIEDDHKFMRSIRSYLNNNGLVYITVPAYQALWSNEDTDAGHYRRYTLKSMRQLLNASGLSVEYATYIFSILPLPVLLFRTIPSLLGGNKKSDDLEKHKKEHASNKGLVDRALKYIWTKELKSIQQGKKIPFGGSCFVIARKQ